MEDDSPQGPLFQDDALLPGLPGRARLQWIFLAALAGLVVIDAIVWHGLLFNSRVWHVLLWGLVFGGLAIGGFAYWHRAR